MQEKKCSDSSHLWKCEQAEGIAGEIVKSTPLDIRKIETLNTDVVQAETICPGGSIICSNCEEVFPGTEDRRKQTDFKNLQSRLKN